MAGNKVNTKTKGKDDKGKANKVVTQNNEDNEDLDFAVLRKPIPTSITGFAQARKIFDLATEELKDLLSNECDILYECKVCRNIFRSLANFISHKRVYCKDKFNTSIHGHFIQSNSTANEMLKIKRSEDEYQESLKAKNEANSNEDGDERIPLTKDLTAIYEKIIKSKSVINSNSEPQVVLKKIPSSTVAVFQDMKFEEQSSDNMRAQVNELDVILSRDKAVLQSDGTFAIESSEMDRQDTDNVIQISDDEDNDDSGVLKCKICDLQFSTQKTLKFHMKYKHLESRLVYPCPDCLEIFSTSWSVYRHLFKVHRKTAAQIRRLRESIQSKAFRMNNPPAFYEKRKNNMKPATVQKITEEERLDQENQAWMDNMEGDGEVPRCGGCGRSFERRAALAAHTHTCQPRCRALQRRPDGKKIEIQIRKDYNKGSIVGLTIMKADDNKASTDDAQAPTKPQIDVEKEPEPEEINADEIPMDVEDDDQKSNDSESPEKNPPRLEDSVKPIVNLPFALQAEKSNLAAFKQRIQSEIDFYKLQCKKCDAKHTSGLQLYEHMAEHVKWMRYACKLCNFKHYKFEKLPEHVKVVHKLKGDSDFYFSTVKAIDGTEAMIISRCLAESESADETNDPNETSPESRRPSRCSSDSSRLSDDSSSSSTLKVETGRKRKMYQNKVNPKKKKDAVANDEGEDQKDGDVDKAMKVHSENSNSSILKTFEENSSDLDDIEEKITKRQVVGNTQSVASRRPVRKRTRPKNEDFEYDLSNLLKMEAQGYRDAQSVTTSKINQTKKKVQLETTINHDNLNKECGGALIALTKKAIATASAHLRTSSFAVYSTREPRPNIFARPSIPRILSRGDKGSPKKDVSDEPQESSPKVSEPPKKIIEPPNATKEVETNESERAVNKEKDPPKTNPRENLKSAIKNEIIKAKSEIIKANDSMMTRVADSETKVLSDTSKDVSKEVSKLTKNSEDGIEQNGTDVVVHKGTTSNFNIPAVVPIQFRRQSLELMKNPLINKNITDFSKAGMKTKILVIKPINRHNDRARAVNNPLKFQTIKLKDPSKGSSSSEDKQPDQVMVVKVPKVPCSTVSEKILPPNKTADVENASSNQLEDKNDNIEKVCEENEVLKNDNEVQLDSEANVDNDKKCNEKNIDTEIVKDEPIEDVAEQSTSLVDEPKTTEVAT